MILFFDTETNGLPKKKKGGDVKDLENWPRVIQLAWAIGTIEGEIIKTEKHLIKPDGWEIPKEKFWIENGFSTEISAAEGVDISSVMIPFIDDVARVQWMASHNMAFDQPILGAEMIRLGLSSNHKPEKICTKEASVEFCKIPFPGSRETRPWMKSQRGYKWPKLSELHVKLFGNDFEGAHDALDDVKALAKCFYELTRRGVITLSTKNPAP